MKPKKQQVENITRQTWLKGYSPIHIRGGPRDEIEEREGPPESPIGDLTGAAILEADIKLRNVYGDYIHQNDGTHDTVWQEPWAKLIILRAQYYQAPRGPVGR
jgi:hypothetical protein